MSSPPLIAVTRPEPDGEISAARYRALGFETLLAPLLEFVALDPNRPDAQKLPDADGLGAIAFTSANAVRAMNGTNTLQPYGHLPAFCVGNHTANAAREGGFSTIHISDGGAEELVELIAKSHVNGPIYYPCATHPAADLATALAPHGAMTIKNPVYEMRAATQMPPVLEAACVSGRLTAIAFYSRRTADIFAQLGAPILDKPVRLSFTALCLSENVAQPMLKNHFTRIALPDYPSEEAMLSCARDILHGLRS